MTGMNFDTKKSALLLMDFQGFVLENFISSAEASRVVGNAAAVLGGVRRAGVLVIHVTVSFRLGYPEITPRNRMFSWLQNNDLVMPGSEGMRINVALTPLDNEPVILKHRIGAFSGTDLDMILRAKGIEMLLFTGVVTSGVVLSTFRQAFDLDYDLMVIGDACADGDADTQVFLMEKLFPQLGTVVSTRDVAAVCERRRI